MIKSLSTMPYAKAKVYTYDNGTKVLKSYSTDVVELTVDGWLIVFGLYSATTRKHISAFMREFTKENYYTAKSCYINNIAYNIYTGEIRDL